MARVWLPDRFLIRSVDEFSAGLDLVTGWYWHQHRLGAVDERGNQTGIAATGSLQAMHWLAGLLLVPPGYVKPRDRTRPNLWEAHANAELSILNSRNAIADHRELDQDSEPSLARGALLVYRWALGLSDKIPGFQLLDEDIRAARAHWKDQHRQAA